MTPQTPTLPTSIVAELALCVRDIFAAIGEPAPVYFGQEYIKQGNAPRRVVFVEDRGKWSKDQGEGGQNKGYVGSEDMGCLAHIWGAPAPRGNMPGAFSVDDAPFHDTDDAALLRRRVINAVAFAGPGVVEGDTLLPANLPTDARYGQAYTIRFLLTQGVPRDAAIWSLPLGPADPLSPPDPQRPPGAPASTVDKILLPTITS